MIERKYDLSHCARELGVARRTLYYWIEKGVIKQPRTTPSGRRYYTLSDILKIKATECVEKGKGV
jgi:DNA-binding transcriptional MerR regulator